MHGIILICLSLAAPIHAAGDSASGVTDLAGLLRVTGDSAPIRAGRCGVDTLTFTNREYRMQRVPDELVGRMRFVFNGGQGDKLRLTFNADIALFAAFHYNDTGAWSFLNGRSALENGWRRYKTDAYRGESNGSRNGKEHFADVSVRTFRKGEALPAMPRWWLCLAVVDLPTAETIPQFKTAMAAPLPPPAFSYHDWATQTAQPTTFPTRDRTTLKNWQETTRRAFIETILFPYEGKLVTQVARSIETGQHIRREITFLLDGKKLFRAFRLEPKSTPRPANNRRPTIVCFMGHGKIAQLLDQPDSYQHACAAFFADNGYLVYAMENVGMEPGADRHLDLDQMLRLNGYGWYSLLFAHQRMLLDHVFADAEVDVDRVGVTGVSTGGLLALSAAAVDPRVRAASVQGIFGSMCRSFITDRKVHCKCGAIPNLLPRFDLPDLAVLIAPRPLHVSNGQTDGFSPQEAKRCLELITPTFRLFGPDAPVPFLTVPAGGHAFALQPALEFFNQHLRPAKQTQSSGPAEFDPCDA